MDVVISISRYLLPFLALVILAKCLITLLLGHPQEKTYGYLIDQVDGQRYALNMWETSIGRSKHCDLVIGYETISRSHAVISISMTSTRRRAFWSTTNLPGKRPKSSLAIC